MSDVNPKKRLEALGRPITPAMIEATISLFAQHAMRPTPDFCSVHRDVAYGEADRHRLDIFSPVNEAALRPILVYVHGGGFVGGDKGAADAPFYNNIGAWAVRTGYVAVTITYRLAPSAPWPAGAEDVAAAVNWLRAHASDYGGDRGSIFVMGQSAGAVHVADYVADSRYDAVGAVAGAILFSGIYDLTRLAHSPMESAYYGNDTTRFAERSSLAGLVATTVPCLYSVAEFDPDSFQKQAGFLIAAHLAVKGILPRMLYFTGHNHLSPTLQVGGPGDDVGAHIADFIERFGH